MSDEQLQTEKYLSQNTQDSEYLRRANRRKWSPLRVRRAIKKTIVISFALVAMTWCILHFSGNTYYQSDGIKLGRILKAMFAELDQETKIWDTIGM